MQSLNQPLLSVKNLSIEIGGARVVDGVSFSVNPGKVLALVGESGCGKSLTAFSLLGLLPEAAKITSGEILLAGKNLAALPEREMRHIRGKDISIIFQEPTASLDPLSTVGSQIAEALVQHQNVSRADARAQSLAMLEAVGIPDPQRRLDQYPFELSGGMCQRIMIAIALICGPRALIADEPTTALDVTIQAQILDVMRKLVRDRGTSIVLITHDMGVVADIADDVAVMYAGRIAEIGPVGAIFSHPTHPYTALLLASVPRLHVTPKADLATIEGTVPSPLEFGVGCRFASRCPLASEQCVKEQPPLFETETGHRSACWHIDHVPELSGAAA
jgi:peptide/nickel transport system ATP-binding protein